MSLALLWSDSSLVVSASVDQILYTADDNGSDLSWSITLLSKFNYKEISDIHAIVP